MVDTELYSIVRHMGLTHQEFIRSLSPAVRDMSLRVDGTHIQIGDSTGRVEIRLGPEQQRRLGSLVLPRIDVRLVFEGFSAGERDEFMRRFGLAFQRGGG